MLAVAVAVAVTPAGTALATPPPPADAALIVRADELVRQGNALLKDGHETEAYEAYRQAWTIHPTAATAANLGNVEVALAKYRDAAEHLRFALRRFPTDGKPSTRSALEELLASVMPEIAVLRLDMQVDPQEVTIDGRLVDYLSGGRDIFVDAGPHDVVATRLGYFTERHHVEVRKGEVATVHLRLDTPSAAEPENAPPPVSAVPATTLSSSAQGKSGLLIGLGAGMAAAGVALGTGFTLAANSKLDEAMSLRDKLVAEHGEGPCAMPSADVAVRCADLKSTLIDSDTFTDTAVWSFALAGAFAIGTLTYVFWPEPTENVSGGVAGGAMRVSIHARGSGVVLGAAW